MKKLFFIPFICVLTFACIFSFSGCRKNSLLLPHVSELRSNVYEGHGDKYSIKASYGYKESPYINDGKVGELSPHTLTFILIGAEAESISFSLEFPHVSEVIDFEITETGSLKATYCIDNFNEKEFIVSLLYSSECETINMVSTIPDGTLNLNDVLTSVEKTQSALVNSYFEDLSFSAEIYARIIVKNDKAYWYIAFGNGKTLKAFLVDGKKGEVLAIREVI